MLKSWFDYDVVSPLSRRFHIVGYGCMTCIGNSGPLAESVVDAIESVSGWVGG